MKLLARSGKLLVRLGKLVTDACRSVCCGCPNARRYDACTPSSCSSAPDLVWICDPSTCQSGENTIKYNGRCYARTEVVVPFNQVPVNDVVLTDGQYVCLPNCLDPQCQDECGQYVQASLCPGQTVESVPPLFVRLDSITSIPTPGCTCGTFRNPFNGNLLCYFIDLNGPKFRLEQLPITAQILNSVVINCNKTCCDCILQCRSPDQNPGEPQYACLGPFVDCSNNGVPQSTPVQVGELRCCCSDTSGGPNQGRFRVDVSGQIRIYSALAGSVARINLDLSGSFTEPFDPSVQQPRWVGTSVADGTVTQIDDPLLGSPGIPCGRWLWHDLGWSGSSVFGFPLHGKCPSETCGVTVWNGSSPGEVSTIDRSIIQITCYSSYRSGKWTYVNPSNGNQTYTVEYFIRSVRYEQGLCGGGCGSSPPVPGSAVTLKGGPYLATNTGCASCGGSTGADTGTGGALI